jgi:hypothetical protein
MTAQTFSPTLLCPADSFVWFRLLLSASDRVDFFPLKPLCADSFTAKPFKVDRPSRSILKFPKGSECFPSWLDS